MKIAIHNSDFEGAFSNNWIEYCKRNNIPFKIVDAYDTDILEHISDCTAFMWHHNHASYKDALFAKQLLYSIEQKGLKVFPNFNTTWHFDDKVGQKYLLEAINAPLVPSYVFYSKNEALEWIKQTDFPKVFKLRGGAGSAHVKLARNRKQARRFTKQAFGRGFSQLNKNEYFKDKYKKWKEGKDSFGLLKGIIRLFYSSEFAKMHPREKGYVYFQDFIPNNNSDIRVVVVKDKAFALKRLVREGDFRASGGGDIIYDKDQIDERCVRIAFDVNNILKSQSIAYDFVFGAENNPLIVEISYGFFAPAYKRCEGYWDTDLNWHKGANFDFCGWMIEGLK